MKQLLTDEEIDKLITSIHINKANLDHIANYNRINGTLLVELRRIFRSVRDRFEKELQLTKDRHEFTRNAFNEACERIRKQDLEIQKLKHK